MKRENTLQKTKLAILSAKPIRAKVAILSADLNKADDNGWRQLLPAGSFTAVDGRPDDTKNKCWFLDKEIAERFIDNTIAYAKKQNILIDYDHQTLHRNTTGQKALAAGWIVDPKNNIEWREGKGIYVRAEWTPPAQAEIDNNQWGALSAIFPYNEDGHPLYLMMAGLTNDPGLREIESLAVLASELLTSNQPQTNQPTTQETVKMNEFIRTLLIALGIIQTDDSVELTDERLTELQPQVIEALNTLKTAAAAAVDVKTEVDKNPEAAPAPITQAIDDASTEIATADEIIAEAALHNINLGVAVPRSVYDKAVAKIAALSAGNTNMTVEQLIAKGRKEGRVIAANEGYLTAVGRTQGVATLSAMLNGLTPIASLAAKQTANIAMPQTQKGVAVLSAEQKEAARLMGKSEADYLKLLKEGTK